MRQDGIPVLPPWRQILVVTDLSVAGIHAAWRAACIARDQGAALWLAALPPAPGAMRPVERAVWQRARRSALRQLAQDIGGALKLQAAPAAGRPGDVPALMAAVDASDLVVMAPGGAQGTGWRFWRRDWVTRVVQDTRTPVLLARRPAGTHYRHMLLATTKADWAPPMLGCVQRVAPHGALEVVLLLGPDGRTRVSDQPIEAISDARRTTQAQAVRALRAASWRAGIADSTVRVLQGSAARVLPAHLKQQAVSLLVVGMDAGLAWRGLLPQAPWPRALWTRSDSDLLCVPVPAKRRTAQEAGQRLRATLRPA